VNALTADSLLIGPEIDPGMPALAMDGSPVRLALKSDNFGAPDFYERALRVLGEP
jgi:3-dehydrotetronate 4-kinase